MKKKSSKFAQQVVSSAREQKTQGSKYGYLSLPKNINLFKETPDSRIRLDFLPYQVTDKAHPDRNMDTERAIPGSLWYRRPYKVHRNIGAANDACVCPTSFGRPCPICNFRAKRLKEAAPAEETKALRPSERNLYVVVPLGEKNYEEKPHIWDISQWCFQDMLNDELDENQEEYGIFPDLEEGLTLRIRFSEELMGKNKFAKVNRIDFQPREHQYNEEILKQVPNLDEVLIVLPFKELEAKFLEIDGNAEPQESTPEIEEEEAPPPTRTRTVAPSRPAPKQEEEEEEEEEIEEEEEEPQRPQRTKDKEAKCVACQGSGKNSKGKTCPICNGTGKPVKKVATSSNQCPHGHVFGKDCENFEECEDCDVWDACFEAK